MTNNTNRAAEAAQPAATSGDAPADLQQLKALALAVGDDAFVGGLPSEAADNFMEAVSPAVVLGLIARIESNEVESYRRGYVEGMEEGARLAVEPATASGDELPPLPEPIEVGGEGWDFEDFKSWKTFTVEQMEAYARAAVSAATKPTADLSKLQRYQFDGNEHDEGALEPWSDGEWVRFADVQSLLATKPAAAPQKDTPESMANSNARFAIDGAIQYGRENRNQPPSTDHWLYEYWNIGRQLNEAGRTGWDNVTPMPATPAASTPAASAEQQSDSSHVMPLFAAPASQQGAFDQVLTDEQIIAAWDAQWRYHGHEPCKVGHLEFGRTVEVMVASRCRAQGGVTNNTDSGNSAASTTGAAQTAEQVRDQALEQTMIEKRIELIPEYEGEWRAYVYRDSDKPQSFGTGPTPSAAVECALRPTPTHSSEAGDA